MGDAAPPIFAARAIPRTRALEKFESAGRFRSRGYLALASRKKSIMYMGLPE